MDVMVLSGFMTITADAPSQDARSLSAPSRRHLALALRARAPMIIAEPRTLHVSPPTMGLGTVGCSFDDSLLIVGVHETLRGIRHPTVRNHRISIRSHQTPPQPRLRLRQEKSCRTNRE